MKLTLILFLLSALAWVVPAHARSIVERTLASRASSMNVQNVSRLSYRKPYILQHNNDEGFSGQLRFQYQQNALGESDKFNGYTARFQAGWQGPVTGNWNWGARLASGGWVQNSALTTLGKTRDQSLGGFGGNPIWLDALYVTYNIKEDFSVRLGQMDNPYFDKSRYNLIWDQDLTPAGLNIQYRKEITDRYTLDMNGSVFLMNPLSSWTSGDLEALKASDNDVTRYMLAASGRFLMVFDDYDFVTQLSFYNINAEGMEVDSSHVGYYFQDILTDAVSDTDSAVLQHKHDYGIVDLALQFRVKNFWQPVSASIQLVQNFMAVDKSQEFGIVAGGVLGETDRARAWNVGYHFFKLSRDVTLSKFTDSDIGGTGSSFNGHHVMANYFLNKAMQVGAKYILRTDELQDTSSHIVFGSLTINI